MRLETIRLPHGEELPMLLDADGLPVPSANEWLMTRRDKSANTLGRNLRELIPLFEWLEKGKVDLWQRVSSAQGFSEAEIRGSLLEALRRDRTQMSVTKTVVGPDTFNSRLDSTARFLKWFFSTCLSRLPGDHRSYDRIQANLDHIQRWFSESRMNPAPESRLDKGLTASEQAALLQCLESSCKAPQAHYKQALKHRDYVIAILLLFCGLRRGELLSLRVKDVVTGSSIPQVNVVKRGPDPRDTRNPRPYVKRNPRILPLFQKWARVVDEYVVEWRDVLLDRGNAATDYYLILADNGEPLSLAQVNKVFRTIRKAHQDTLPEHLTPHALRHSFSANTLIALQNAGLDEAAARRQLALLRGDKSEKSQDVYVKNEVGKQASARLLEYQRTLAEVMEDIPL